MMSYLNDNIKMLRAQIDDLDKSIDKDERLRIALASELARMPKQLPTGPALLDRKRLEKSIKSTEDRLRSQKADQAALEKKLGELEAKQKDVEQHLRQRRRFARKSKRKGP